MQKTRALLAAAERVRARRPDRARTLLGRAARVLEPVAARANAAVTSGGRGQRVSAECAAAVTAVVGRTVSAVGRLGV